MTVTRNTSASQLAQALINDWPWLAQASLHAPSSVKSLTDAGSPFRRLISRVVIRAST